MSPSPFTLTLGFAAKDVVRLKRSRAVQARKTTPPVTTRTGERLVSTYGLREGPVMVEMVISLADGAAGHLLLRVAKGGDAASLYRVALSLSAEVPLSVPLDGDTAPVVRGVVDLPRDANMAEAFRLIGRDCLEQILDNAPCLVAGVDTEGVHQMRVALRRLRSAMKICRKMLKTPQTAHLRDGLKWLGGVLGAARDMDVFMEEILGPVERTPDNRKGLDALTRRFTLERRRRAKAAVAAVRSSRFAVLTLELGLWLEAGDWTAPCGAKQKARLKKSAVAFARKELSRDESHMRALGDEQAIRDMPETRRHALRIDIKKIRYAAEFFKTLFPEREAESLFKALAGLQNALGVLNDIAVAHAFLDSVEAENLATAKADVIVHHQARAEKALMKSARRWQAFVQAPVFWRKS